MFSASVVLKHIHKVAEKLIFSPPLHVLLDIVILNGPAYPNSFTRPRRTVNFNDTKAKRIKNPLKFRDSVQSCICPFEHCDID